MEKVRVGCQGNRVGVGIWGKENRGGVLLKVEDRMLRMGKSVWCGCCVGVGWHVVIVKGAA